MKLSSNFLLTEDFNLDKMFGKIEIILTTLLKELNLKWSEKEINQVKHGMISDLFWSVNPDKKDITNNNIEMFKNDLIETIQKEIRLANKSRVISQIEKTYKNFLTIIDKEKDDSIFKSQRDRKYNDNSETW